MKTILILFIALFISMSSASQNGINYKALIKDDLGNVIANSSVDIKFKILEGDALTNVYEETHSPTTDTNGIIIVNIGEGTIINGIFDNINWGEDHHFLNVKIDTGSGFVDLGTTQFSAVPYALHAKKAANVKGLEPIDEGNGNGWRLIGRNINNYDNIGFNAIDLSFVDDSNLGLGATGSYAFSLGYNGTASGEHALAFGNQNYSLNDYAIALGNNNVVSGLNSTAIGGINQVSGDYSFAAGLQNEASENYSIAMGNNAIASGEHAVAMGRNTIASGLNSTALGRATEASSYFTTAMGLSTKASGDYSTAMGRETEASGGYSTAMGRATKASGDYSTAMGFETEASESRTTAMGSNTRAAAIYSTAMGYQTLAFGVSATAMGHTTYASGSASTATGRSTRATGNYSIAMGDGTQATGENSTAMGLSTIASGFLSTAVGRFNIGGGITNIWVGTDPLFEIGNGSSDTDRNNALTVLKNGNVGIGTHTPQELLHISGGRLRIGSETIEDTGSNRLSFNASLLPDVDDAMNLGNANFRWNAVWSVDGTINTSDRREKKNIKNLNYGLAEVLKMQPVSFNWKSKNNPDTKLGLIAQEIQTLIPEVVKAHIWEKDEVSGTLTKKELERLGVYYSDLVPVLIKAIQEQQQIIDIEKSINVKQKSQLAALLFRIENLESKSSN